MTIELAERYAIIRIAYSYDQDRNYNGDEPEQIAVGLALNPNTRTVDSGVRLESAEFCGFND